MWSDFDFSWRGCRCKVVPAAGCSFNVDGKRFTFVSRFFSHGKDFEHDEMKAYWRIKTPNGKIVSRSEDSLRESFCPCLKDRNNEV